MKKALKKKEFTTLKEKPKETNTSTDNAITEDQQGFANEIRNFLQSLIDEEEQIMIDKEEQIPPVEDNKKE